MAMRRTSREALLRSSHTIADITRRLQVELNMPPARSAACADERAKQLAWAKSIVDARRERDRLFGKGLFSEAAWEILLELFIAHHEGRDTAIKTACHASTVPQTTALRYIAHLVERGLAVRRPHPQDSRCTHLRLSERGLATMIEYFRRMKSGSAAPAA